MKMILTITVIFLACMLGSAFILQATTPSTKAQADLVGYWKFDEGSGTTAHDSSDYGNTGILYNGPEWATGRHGKALSFDGSDDFVLVSDSSSLHLYSAVTVEAWVYLPTGADYSNWGKILTKNAPNGGTNLDFGIWNNDCQVNFGVGHSGGFPGQAEWCFSVRTVPRDVWTHVAATYDGSLMKIYFNGIQDSTASFAGGINTDNGRPLTIGKNNFYPWSNEFWFNGAIDEVRIYNRALSQQEIQSDMNGGITPQDDLWIENIEPIQTLINPSIMIPGKPTVFKVAVASTFSVEKQTHLLITCNELEKPTVSWYEGPYSVKPNQETVIYTGGKQVWGQNYRPSDEFDVKIKVDAFNKINENDETNNELQKHIGPQNGYTFKNLGQLKILYVPVGFWAGTHAWLLGDPKIPYNNITREAAYGDSFIKAVFPVNPKLYKSEIAAEYPLPAPIFDDPIGATRCAYAALVVAELDSVIKLYHLKTMGGYDRIVLVVPDRGGELWLKYWLNKDALGMTLLSDDSVCWAEEGYWTTPAHELWHTYTQISEHCSCTGTGYWDYAHAIGSCGLINGGLGAQCLMGEGGNVQHQYESDWAYRWICPQCYADLVKLQSFRYCNDPEVIFVSGTVFRNDTVILKPFYHFSEDYVELEPGHTGNYTLRFLDAEQHLLSNIGFNTTFTSESNITSFGFSVPYTEGIAQIQLLHGETVIASRNVSENAPAVSITYPNDGEMFASGENFAIMWEAIDADNDTLSYTALYTPDNGTNWIPIQTAINATSLNWTVPNDHPSNQCRIKVVATDGINTGEDVSDAVFTILRHDVSVSNVSTSKNVVGEGFSPRLNITAQNRGNFTENFNAILYANDSAVLSQPVILNSGNSVTLALAWNTSGFSKGNYILSVLAEPVSGEIYTLDNTAYGDPILITVRGDVDGDLDVNIIDVVKITSIYGSKLGNLEFSPNSDIDGDGAITILDVVICTSHYGEKWP